MTTIDDVPDWAKPLTAGPIEVDELTESDELAREIAERLGALLRLYNCDATPEGWRSLALRLALDHEIDGRPAMKIVTPIDRQPQIGGAEPGKNFWLALRLRKKAQELGSVKGAAIALSKTSGVSIRRLQNIAAEAASGKTSKPRFLARLLWESKINAALDRAATTLEARSRN